MEQVKDTRMKILNEKPLKLMVSLSLPAIIGMVVIGLYKEFLLKGYEKASVRTICKKAGVTTGALYFLFENKEKLFHDMVNPFLVEWKCMAENMHKTEILHPETAEENERQLMCSLYRNKDLFILAMEKSNGTKYAGLPRQLENILKDYFKQYFKFHLRNSVEDKLIAILVQGKIQSYMTIVKESRTLEEALQLTKCVACYADAGTKAVINQINEKEPIKP